MVVEHHLMALKSYFLAALVVTGAPPKPPPMSGFVPSPPNLKEPPVGSLMSSAQAPPTRTFKHLLTHTPHGAKRNSLSCSLSACSPPGLGILKSLRSGALNPDKSGALKPDMSGACCTRHLCQHAQHALGPKAKASTADTCACAYLDGRRSGRSAIFSEEEISRSVVVCLRQPDLGRELCMHGCGGNHDHEAGEGNRCSKKARGHRLLG